MYQEELTDYPLRHISIPKGWLGAETDSEATREIEIQGTGGIGKPGLYRIYVRCLAREAEHVVSEAAPIEFRIR